MWPGLCFPSKDLGEIASLQGKVSIIRGTSTIGFHFLLRHSISMMVLYSAYTASCVLTPMLSLITVFDY